MELPHAVLEEQVLCQTTITETLFDKVKKQMKGMGSNYNKSCHLGDWQLTELP